MIKFGLDHLIMVFDEKYLSYDSSLDHCDALRNLIPFTQFKKREKHPWMSVTFSKVADFRLEDLCF